MRRPQLAVLAPILLLVACSHSSPSKPAHRIDITETPDSAATIQPGGVHAVGHLAVRVLTAQCGIESIVGTHAEYNPARPLCVVRLRVSSEDSTYHVFDSRAQRLVLAGDVRVAPAPDVMDIKRQQPSIQLGAHNVVELDLWFEPPVGAKPTALAIQGDADPDSGGPSVGPAKARSALVPLRLPSG